MLMRQALNLDSQKVFLIHTSWYMEVSQGLLASVLFFLNCFPTSYLTIQPFTRAQTLAAAKAFNQSYKVGTLNCQLSINLLRVLLSSPARIRYANPSIRRSGRDCISVLLPWFSVYFSLKNIFEINKQTRYHSGAKVLY